MNHTRTSATLISALCTLVLTLSGCTLEPALLANSGKVSQLNESRGTWEAQRDAHQGSYTYSTYFQSWTGYRSNTTVVVDDNTVVERSFSSSFPNEQGTIVEESWQETTPETLGEHQEGAPAKTIDALYTDCAENVLSQSPQMNDIFLEFRSDGILERCTYVPNNCADDCEEGIRIDSLTFTAPQE